MSRPMNQTLYLFGLLAFFSAAVLPSCAQSSDTNSARKSIFDIVTGSGTRPAQQGYQQQQQAMPAQSHRAPQANQQCAPSRQSPPQQSASPSIYQQPPATPSIYQHPSAAPSIYQQPSQSYQPVPVQAAQPTSAVSPNAPKDKWGLSANFPLPKHGDEAIQFAFPLAEIEAAYKNSTQGQLEDVARYHGLGDGELGKGVSPRKSYGSRTRGH